MTETPERSGINSCLRVREGVRERGKDGERERERRAKQHPQASEAVICLFNFCFMFFSPSFLDAGVSAWIRLPVSLLVLVSVDLCVCNFFVPSNSSFNTRAIRSALQD